MCPMTRSSCPSARSKANTTIRGRSKFGLSCRRDFESLRSMPGGNGDQCMGGIIEMVDPLFVALAFSAAMLGAWSIGWWRGGQALPEPLEDPGIKFTDAALALLGLL